MCSLKSSSLDAAVIEKTTFCFVLHNKRNRTALSDLTSATFFGIEVVLSWFSAYNLAVSGDFEAFGE